MVIKHDHTFSLRMEELLYLLPDTTKHTVRYTNTRKYFRTADKSVSNVSVLSLVLIQTGEGGDEVSLPSILSNVYLHHRAAEHWLAVVHVQHAHLGAGTLFKRKERI